MWFFFFFSFLSWCPISVVAHTWAHAHYLCHTITSFALKSYVPVIFYQNINRLTSICHHRSTQKWARWTSEREIKNKIKKELVISHRGVESACSRLSVTITQVHTRLTPNIFKPLFDTSFSLSSSPHHKLFLHFFPNTWIFRWIIKLSVDQFESWT